ncbi:MAG: tyrosine-type recombinase/integrase [Gemmatimonadaceae bacterium]
MGRIAISSRTRSLRERNYRDSILTKLANSAQVSTLRDLKAGRISIEQLVEADRRGMLDQSALAQEIALTARLWDSVRDALPNMGHNVKTQERYRTAFAAFRRYAGQQLSETATIRDLASFDWRRLRNSWQRSAAHWNNTARAISAFLSIALGDKDHPFRRKVMRPIPRAAERPRVPDLTPEAFWQVLETIPEPLRSAYLTLVLTGMRVSEYLNCTAFHLKQSIRAVDVPGTKTAWSSSVIRVDEDFWPAVQRAIPCPLGIWHPVPTKGVQFDARYKRLRLTWNEACKRLGLSVRLHDLRHCTAQWVTDEGLAEAKVQAALRHSTPNMTRRYTLSKDRGEVAATLAKVLRPRRAS